MIVQGVGPTDAKIVFVGEAPGEEEAKTGQPFIGAAGRLLTELLTNVGIIRPDVYITNVIKERPPSNNVDHFIRFPAKGGVVTTAAYDTWEQRLYEELLALKPNLVVALGRVPLWALCRESKIMNYNASVMMSTTLREPIKVLACIHPAAALYNYILRHHIHLALRKIKKHSQTRELVTPKRNLRLRPTYEEVLAYLDDIHYTSDTIGYDIEVVNEEVFCIGIAKNPLDVICIPFYENNQNYFEPEQEVEIWKKIAEMLYNPRIAKVGQNIIFDATFLFNKYGILTRTMEDTMIGQAIICPDLPKGLDFICAAYTDEPYYKADGKKWFKLGGDIESFWRYNALDAAVCLEAIDPILQRVDALGVRSVYERHIQLIEPLMFMQEHGIKMDTDTLKAKSVEAEEKLEKLQALLDSIAGTSLNINSPKQLKEYFYEIRGEKPYTKYNKHSGSSSTTVDEKALTRLARKGYKEADVILEMRRIKKAKSTYYDMKLGTGGRIRCSFNPVGTKQGRLSSSQSIFGEGANMQNQTSEMKQAMVADEGYVMINVDLSQAENRVVAYLANDQNMISAFHEGKDIHSRTAGLIFGKPETDISREKGSSPLGDGTKSERDWGKRANHGLNYGLGYKTFAMYNYMPERDAKFIVDRYHAAYPGVRQVFHASINRQLRNGRIVRNLIDRQRLFLDRMDDSLLKEAFSFIPQSTVADIINMRGLIPLYYEQDNFEPVVLLNQVHDSILFEVPLSVGWQRIAQVCMSLKFSLEQAVRFQAHSFIIPSDFAIGLNAYEMKEFSPTDIATTTKTLEKLYNALISERAPTQAG